jgi:hypothetical protein
MTHRYVSGPTNVVRLENKKLNKILFVFMDVHNKIYAQYECQDIRKEHIDEYFVKEFDRIKNDGKKYDFFLEEHPNYIMTKPSMKTNIYIGQLRKMFNNIFEYKFEQNKVLQSKEFKNIRFHYLDFRYYIPSAYGVIYKDIPDIIWNIPRFSLAYNTVITINNLLKHAMLDVYMIKNLFEKEIKRVNAKPTIKNPNERYTTSDFNNIMNNIIYKIKNVYHSNGNKIIMNDIINNNMLPIIEHVIDKYDKYIKYSEQYAKKLNYDDEDKIGNQYFKYLKYDVEYNDDNEYIKNVIYINNKISEIYSNLVDLFFLRRFVDKDYINNAVVYTGQYHSINYIYYLTKFFNYEMTHANYIQKQKFNKAIETTSNTNFNNELETFFLQEKFNQCVDMNKLPELFS